MAPFAASDPAIISASHEESATDVCFFDDQLTVADPIWNGETGGGMFNRPIRNR